LQEISSADGSGRQILPPFCVLGWVGPRRWAVKMPVFVFLKTSNSLAILQKMAVLK
jgi:hypothetical protein